jgi:mRNA interferase RelE/StbE
LKISFKASVEKDLRKIDPKERTNIINKINTELLINPGNDKKLSGEYKDLYSYRIGNYRVIYTLMTDEILILRIGHRKDVYS